MTADAAVEPTAPPRSRLWPRSLIYSTCALVAAIWVILDQATKLLAVELLEDPGRVVDLGVFDLHAIRNPGGAFGFPGFPGLFVLVTAVVLFLVLRALPGTRSLSLAIAYGLVTGGAVGNLVDRLFRYPGFPRGWVVDFVDLRWWPVFNVADVGIVVGAGAIALLLTKVDREQRAEDHARASNESVRPDTTAPRH